MAPNRLFKLRVIRKKSFITAFKKVALKYGITRNINRARSQVTFFSPAMYANAKKIYKIDIYDRSR